MRKRIVAGVLACGAVAPAAALGSSGAPKLPKFPSKLIVPGKSAGGVSLGEGAAKAIRAWRGNSSCTPSSSLVECTWGSDANGADGSISLSFANGKVTLITLQLDGNTRGIPIYKGPMMALKTKQGIGLKSTVAQLEKHYPGHVGTNSLGDTLGTGTHTTTFRTSGGEFVAILIGTPPNY
jgi:hypothetical protein